MRPTRTVVAALVLCLMMLIMSGCDAATPAAPPTNTPAPPTATATNTAVPATPTATNTAVPPTATATNTAVPPTPTATVTDTPPPTATATNTAVPPTNTPSPTPRPRPTNTPTPTATPPPAAVNPYPLPDGKGGLLVRNYIGKEMTFTIDNKEYRIAASPGNGVPGEVFIVLNPNTYTYSVTVPGGSTSDTITVVVNKIWILPFRM